VGDLKVGTLNILEPKPEMPELYPDILLTPLCAYDSQLNRLGFGSGFYDRYIGNLRSFKKCHILAPAFQV
jgi:5-formyltetrahydrofolate cyclo-ligase